MGFSRWLKRPVNLIGILVVAIWVGVGVYYLAGPKKVALKWPTSLAVQPGALPAEGWEEWYGNYFQGRKIGYSQTSRQVIPEGYLYRDHTHLWLNVSGEAVEADTNTEARVGKDLRLQKIDFRLHSQEAETLIDGKVEGNKLILGIKAGGERTQQVIEIQEAPLTMLTVRDYLLRNPQTKLEVGQKFKLPFFDPMTMANAELEIEVLGTENLKIGEKLTSVFRMKESFKGDDSLTWVTPEGKTIKEYSPRGFVVQLQPREEAEKPDSKSEPLPDLIQALAIPVKGKIDSPRELKYLKIVLNKVVLTGFDLTGHRQTLNDRTVEVRMEDPGRVSSYPLPWSEIVGGGNEAKESLQATPFIPLGNAELVKAAKGAAEGNTDSLKAARSIMVWVNRNLKKVPTFSIPSALQILKDRQGDCNEHTLLFVALARQVGLPARMAAGIVYLEGKFFYHAWAEVYIGGGDDGWITIDPVFAQLPADATHVRFISGDLDRQVEITRFVGFLETQVVTAR
ncbi:MAG: lasso peptide biosynthesis protein [Proteobacteria bacterium]|nr:lasso peptide biosynthesis protein [Pseudomonadota bacterium]